MSSTVVASTQVSTSSTGVSGVSTSSTSEGGVSASSTNGTLLRMADAGFMAAKSVQGGRIIGSGAGNLRPAGDFPSRMGHIPAWDGHKML